MSDAREKTGRLIQTAIELIAITADLFLSFSSQNWPSLNGLRDERLQSFLNDHAH
jgi:hypothetical protein